MFEDGLVKLIQSDGNVLAVCGPGGFTVQIPQTIDAYTKPLWTWFFVTDKPDTALQIPGGMINALIQIDIYGATMPQVSSLSYAINTVLEGFQGLLGDPQNTQITSCFRTDKRDFPFDSDSRIFRRMLEYEVTYYVNNATVTP